MKNAIRIAGLGLAAGAAVMIAAAAPASPRGPGEAGGMFGAGPRAGLFTVQFADLDTDGDGLITEAELAARAEALLADRLAGVDADGDGTVTADELEAAVLARIGSRTEDRAQGRPGAGRRAADPAERAAAMAERMLAARDSDGDGALSGAELSPAAEIAALIDRFDTDDDNAWNAEEFAQAMARKAGFGRQGRDGRGGHGGDGGRDGKRR